MTIGAAFCGSGWLWWLKCVAATLPNFYFFIIKSYRVTPRSNVSFYPHYKRFVLVMWVGKEYVEKWRF